MEVNKFSKKKDAIAHLYRAALYLVRGSKKTGFNFFRKAKSQLPFLFDLSLSDLKTRSQQLFWAEKILDEYLRLKNLNF